MGIAPVNMIGYQQPYVYNTNKVSSASLGKVNPISADPTKSRMDFSGILEESIANLNPLEIGETVNYEDMVNMQLQMGRSNAARIFG